MNIEDMSIQQLTDKVFETLVDNGVAKEFREMMRLKAEMVMRDLPNTPTENRQMAEGQILICLSLADGAKAALESAEAEAKAEAEERTRAELQLASELSVGGIP